MMIELRAFDMIFEARSQALLSSVRAVETIDVRNARGQTALLVSVWNNDVETARQLIEAGADVNAKDDIEDSPYLLAGARGQLEILKVILCNGADLKSTNRYGGTALIPAAERGYVETVGLLLGAGVDPDHINNLGWTALFEAIILGDNSDQHYQIIRMLLEAGANPDLVDGNGVTALQHAKERGFSRIIQLLE